MSRIAAKEESIQLAAASVTAKQLQSNDAAGIADHRRSNIRLEGLKAPRS
jgi:hypothetical protein